MGERLAKVEIIPKENEQIDIVIKVPDEPRSIIHGTVTDCFGNVIEDAVVKLFEVENPCNPCSLKPVSYAFSDESGQFLFGPLTPCKHYVIKVWVSDIKDRNLVIKPEEDDELWKFDHMDVEQKSGRQSEDIVIKYEEQVDEKPGLMDGTEAEIQKNVRPSEKPREHQAVKRRPPARTGNPEQEAGKPVVRRQRQPQ